MYELSSLKLGALLGQANLVRPDDLKASVPMAKKMRLPIGRVLVSTGALSDELLEAALSAQSLIRERLIPAETAIKALKDAKEKGITLSEALAGYGLKIEQLEFTNKLGQLLVDSEYVTSDERHEALQVALGTGLPLGRVLVFKQLLSNASAYAALSAQVLIRGNRITREQALEALKKSNNDHYSFEQALNEHGCGSVLGSQKVMLGQLLVSSNLISEIDFLMGLEKSLAEESPLGQVLIDLQMLTPEKLQNALTLQSRVTENLCSVDEAAVYLQQGRSDIPQAPQEKVPPPELPAPESTVPEAQTAQPVPPSQPSAIPAAIPAAPPTPPASALAFSHNGPAPSFIPTFAPAQAFQPAAPSAPVPAPMPVPELAPAPQVVSSAAMPEQEFMPALQLPPPLPPRPLYIESDDDADSAMEAPIFAEPLNPEMYATFNRPTPAPPEDATMRLARAVKQIPVVDPSVPFGVLELLIFGRLISHSQAEAVRIAARDTGYREDYLLLEQELINVNTLKGVTQCLGCYKDGSITAEEAVLAFYTWYSRPDEPVENVISLVTQRDFI